MDRTTGMAARRATATGRDLTQGSILRNLLSLSWPMIIANSVNMIGPTVDMIWVGRLGSAAIAGVGVSGIAVMLAQSGLMGLFMGLRAMVARFIGAGDDKQANHVAQQAIVIGAVSSVVLAVIGIFLAEEILVLVGVQEEVISQGAGYLRIQFVGMTAMAFRMMSESIMQASGDTQTPMKIAVVFRLIHVLLSPVLIFGLWIFPRMGLNGAAVTNVISQSAGTALAFWFLMTGRSRLKLSFKGFRIDPPTIWHIVRIGIPASIMGMERNLAGFILLRFMAPFGTVALASHTLNQRIEMFLFMPASGLGAAAGVLVGQNLGAGRPDRAERSGWVASLLVEGCFIVFAVVLLLWAEVPVRIFSSDPSVVATAATFLRIATAGYIVMGVATVFQQCISSSGDTILPMVVSFVTAWLVQLPLAYFLPRVGDLGVYGVRWALVIPTVVGAIAYTVYYRRGRWKHKEI